MLTISAVGDVSFGDHPVRAGFGMRRAIKRHSETIAPEIQRFISSADLAVANLEIVTSDVGLRRYWLPSYEMRGRPSSLDTLKQSGFDILGVANNHAIQHGEAAFRDMCDQIRSRGMAVAGVDENDGNTAAVEHVHDGLKSVLFAVSTRPEQWTSASVPYSQRLDEKKLLREVETMRKSCSGFLICSIHWGLEFLTEPGPQQVRLGHALIDAGVDLILGHHPHVLQPVEEYGSGLIFYSLGNFLFDLWPDDMRRTCAAKITLSKQGKHSYEILPIQIQHDLTVRVADSVEANKIKQFLQGDVRLIAQNDIDRCQSDYEKRYRKRRKLFRINSYKYFARNILQSPLHFTLQSLGRTALRRITGL